MRNFHYLYGVKTKEAQLLVTEENLKNLAEIMQRVKSYIQNGDGMV